MVSIGYPGLVLGGRPTADPSNLGRGWVGFDFAAALGRPVKVVNDAAMLAIRSSPQAFRLDREGPGGRSGGTELSFAPQPKTTAEGIGIVPRATTRR